MDEKEKIQFIEKELEAIYEELDANLNESILLRYFLKDLLSVIKGAEPSYKLSVIKNKELF